MSRRHVYAEDKRLAVIRRIREGRGVAQVAALEGVPATTVEGWCREEGIPLDGRPERLVVWVPSNRRDSRMRPTHMDGYNEMLAAYKRHHQTGARMERENLMWVASYVAEAMREQGWAPMATAGDAVRCRVELHFVEPSRRRDLGNIHAGSKYALDALTHRNERGASAIWDDSQRWLSEVAYAVSVDPARPGLRIIVERDPERP